MPDLIAQGPEAQQRWRRTLPEDEPVVLGRLGTVWSAPWDAQISRQHVRLVCSGNRLDVTRLHESRNPVFHLGHEVTHCVLAPGDHFVLGQTIFTLADQQAGVSDDAPMPVQQQSFSSQYLKQVQFRNPNHRIEVLSRLPDVISGAIGDKELFVRLVGMLLAGIHRADAAAVVAVEQGDCVGSPHGSTPHVLHWDQRLAITNDFRPSRGLILESLRQQQSVLQIWRGSETTSNTSFTASDAFDWAFCVPVPGKTSRGWCLYVAGRFQMERAVLASSDSTDLREDVKFTELVSATLASLRKLQLLEQRQATLRQFFSPVVLDTLAVEDPEVVLAPRETEVSVLFCDLRGFSRESERQSNDLIGLLHRVSQALGVMTHHIREQGGVVGDLQGDAAMGFWGWPLQQDDAVERACFAALAVRKESEATTGFRSGIGVATGRAVAGKIGTADQVKVTVFGPVVNLASRLEGMTKYFQASILLDDVTAGIIRRRVPREVARVRRLAVVRPYGLDMALEVSELLPPVAEYPELTEEHLSDYEAAFEAFLARQWPKAFELLHRIPAVDQVKDFLTVYIARHNRKPPADWDGVIELESK